MRHTAILALLLSCLFPAAAICHAQDDFAGKYLQKVSLSSPIAPDSIKDLIEKARGHHPKYSSPSTGNFFPYMPHQVLDVPRGVRVMIFSPHPDDESLAASGLIQRVVEKGGKVRVVFVTNGDGYEEALRLRLKKAKISAQDFIDYGKRRQQEATNAACTLGLHPDDVVFLGFPDDGIDDLWESYWSKLKPFVSPHTLFDRPQRKGKKRWVKYSGVELDQEIARVLTEFKPDWVVLPDPRDFHPDHAATGVFVLDALRGVHQEPKPPFAPRQVLTYLVHFKDYPHDAQWAKIIPASGIGTCKRSAKTLANARWMALPLSPEEVEGKRRALLSHASQIEILGDFFKSFLLPCELFARLDMKQVITVPQEYAAYYHHSCGAPENDAAQRSGDAK